MQVAEDKKTAPILIRRAQTLSGELLDLRLAQGVIAELGTQLDAQAGDTVIEARGNLLMPGLCDHHLHLFATAAAQASLPCGPPQIHTATELKAMLQKAASNESGWLRGVGFHDSVCPELDRHWLDAVCPDQPVRIQHRSGMMWIFNSAAINELQLDESTVLPDGAQTDSTGELTGRFYNLDRWLGDRLPRRWPSLAALSQQLLSYGITAVTDTGVNNSEQEWQALKQAQQQGELRQRLQMMGNETLNTLITNNSARLFIGPLKIYLREVNLPEYEQLVSRIRAAHEVGRPVAAHCVTRVELTFMLAALREAGVMAGDRIEHASIADDDALQEMSLLGVIAVTQPHFIAERGVQYLQDVDPEDVPFLYRGAAFLQQGVKLAAGSDAPYGSIDPWAAMRAAVARSNRNGVIMAEEECLSPLQALNLYAGPLTAPGESIAALAVGQMADLCLLDAPCEQVLSELCADRVAMTFSAGVLSYQRDTANMES